MEDTTLSRLQPGDIVKHFKRDISSKEVLAAEPDKYLYRIVCWARHSENDEKYVVYRALYGSRETWVRPYGMFLEAVDRIKYPQVQQTFRFEKYEGPVECKD